MEFNTQICTTREQSERLLAMGLKPDTADMYITNMSIKGMYYTDDWQIGSISYTDVCRFWKEKGLKIEDTAWEIVPAWSLHRLWVINNDIYAELSIQDTYDCLIDEIEDKVRHRLINSEYLIEKQI